MKLTPDYRSVTSVFGISNTAREIKPIRKEYEAGKPVFTRFTFEVGPFVYVITFKPNLDNLSEVRVDFGLYQIELHDQKLVEMMSKIVKRRVSLEEAQVIKRKMLDSGGVEKVGVGADVSLKVFGTVLNTVKSYIDQHHPECLIIKGEKDRESLYRRLIQRAFPQAILVKLQDEENLMGFRVCIEQ